MIPRKSRTVRFMRVLAVLSAVVIVPGDTLAFAQSVRPVNAQAASSGEASRIPPDQLDSLVAPIALYPDPLLAQTLAASTYPLELMQLQQWLTKNPGLKDKALADAVSRQPWDPSIQAMAALPDVVKWLTDDIQWTTDLGNAFLAQEGDVMDAVQRMRQKAQNTGNLKSTPQQTVETEVVENRQVIVIEQADPQVLYVPSYNPVAVYGPPVYPYPPIYYPPYSASPGWTAAGMAVSWGVGVAMGAAWGGGWGWRAGWGHNDININNNNYFNRNANINRGNVSNTWQHNPQHRGGAPYRDRATAARYGGAARGDSLASRQANARQQVSQRAGNVRSGAAGTSGLANRAGGAGVSDRMAGTAGRANRAGSAGVSDRMAGTSGRANRAGGAGVSDRMAGNSGLGNRAGSAGITSRPSGGGADRVGSRDLSRSVGGGNSNAFAGGAQRFNGSGARASSDRGFSSLQSRGGGSHFGGGSRGGGGFHGGGGRGGGGRGGGGRGGGRR